MELTSDAHKEFYGVTYKLLKHPVLVDCQRQIQEAVALPAGYDILLVVGPTGAGKTKLMTNLLKDSAEGRLLPSWFKPANPAGAIPVVSVTAHNGKNFASRWKALLLDILRVVNPVLFEVGRVADGKAARPTYTGPSLDKTPIPQILSLVTDALKLRSTRAILVDEAQHLAPAASGPDYGLMAESLKELGSNAQTVLVLFGSYSLLSFLSVSGQLARRSSPVHFRRYLMTDLEDSTNFQRVFCSFCTAAPTLLPYALLSASLPLLYCGSMGCTGVLHDWLVRAMAKAISVGAPSVTPAILEQPGVILPTGSLNQMLAEVQIGEEMYRKMYSPMQPLMKAVLADAMVPVTPVARGKARPGQRNPTRDLVGTGA